MRKRVTRPSNPDRPGLQPLPNSTSDLPIEDGAEGSNAVLHSRPSTSLAGTDLLPIVDSAAPTSSEHAGTQRETVTRADHAFRLADRAIADEVARHTGESMECRGSLAGPSIRQRRRLRVGVEVFDRIAAIGRREQVSRSILIERMIATWERQRLAEAEGISPRQPSEDDDTYIARVLRVESSV
ncbi:hypothetical protein [Methylobacterium dankookense]|uniref:hypothetical protein n=1 Tax=Methylobacterium dankookense TaxID=560405 RepID=UPI00119FA468|nr:hypothetical protein [Methylobacterium dankookense]